MSKVISIRLEDELSSQLDTLAVSLDRPKAWVIDQAIRRYVREQACQAQAIQEARDDYHLNESDPGDKYRIPSGSRIIDSCFCLRREASVGHHIPDHCMRIRSSMRR